MHTQEAADNGPEKNRDDPAKSSGGKKTEGVKSDGSSTRTAGGKKSSSS